MYIWILVSERNFLCTTLSQALISRKLSHNFLAHSVTLIWVILYLCITPEFLGTIEEQWCWEQCRSWAHFVSGQTHRHPLNSNPPHLAIKYVSSVGLLLREIGNFNTLTEVHYQAWSHASLNISKRDLCV